MCRPYRAKTDEFIRAVKEYRHQSGEGLRVAFDRVSSQIERGELKIHKYQDGKGEYLHPEFTAEQLQSLYLTWVNDYLSISHFANDHDLTVKQAEGVIIAGRAINEAVATYANLKKEI